MDLDALVASRRPTWERLAALSRRRRLSGAEADELVDLYQQVATDLSLVRSRVPDPTVVAYLSGLLGGARVTLAGTRPASTRGVAMFFWRRFPAALYRTRRWWVGTMVTWYAVAALATWWLLAHPQVESSLLDPRQVDQLVNNDFESYYSDHAAAAFAGQVWTNNAWIAALSLGAGVLGVPVVFVLWQNLTNLAVVASLMIRHDRAGLFFGLILPHGLLELTAIFVAAGIGLRVFWSWLSPGPEPRAQALAREGRTAGGVALGLVVVLFVSGLIEAFVTPSGLPTAARIAIGVTAEALFLAWVFVVGRRACREGETGDIGADLREDVVPTV